MSTTHLTIATVILGAFLFIFVLSDMGGTEDRAGNRMVMHAVQLIEDGSEAKGLSELEALANKERSIEAMRILAEEYSNSNYNHYDMERALEFAEMHQKYSKSSKVYDETKAKALSSWKHK